MATVRTLAYFQGLTQVTADDFADLLVSIPSILGETLALASGKAVTINGVTCLAARGAHVANAAGITAGAPAVTVGTALGAFSDPPSAGEMADLRTFVNALKTDNAATLVELAKAVSDLTALIAKVTAALAAVRTSGVIASS